MFTQRTTSELFPVPLWGFDLDNSKEVNTSIENRVYQKSKNEKSRHASNEGGWHSEGNMSDDPVMKSLLRFIEWAVGELSTEAGMKYSTYKIFLWTNLNRPGDYNSVHSHPDSQLSGVYYVKIPSGDCGTLRLYNPMYHYNYPNSQGYNIPFTTPTADVINKEGSLYIFRSPIMHDVTRNNTQEDRISVSFNIVFDSNLYK